MTTLNAAQIEVQYGTELATQSGGERALRLYLVGKPSGVKLTDGGVREWSKRYRLPAGNKLKMATATKTKELIGKYNDLCIEGLMESVAKPENQALGEMKFGEPSKLQGTLTEQTN